MERETSYPCRYIDPKSNQLFLFRVAYYKCRIHFEVFHAVTDGMGAVQFIRELTYRYLQLRRGHAGELLHLSEDSVGEVEDSYLRHYKKIPGSVTAPSGRCA